MPLAAAAVGLLEAGKGWGASAEVSGKRRNPASDCSRLPPARLPGLLACPADFRLASPQSPEPIPYNKSLYINTYRFCFTESPD